MTSSTSFLNTVAGESAFFRALCEARPIGIHREFHMMAVASHIKTSTGEKVSVDDLWTKFKECYNPAVLEQYEHPGYSDTGSTSTSDDDNDGEELEGRSRRRSSSSHPNPKPKARDPPKIGDDLEHHPFFRHEFTLPESYGPLPEPEGRSSRRRESTTSNTRDRPAVGAPSARATRGNRGQVTKTVKETAPVVTGESDSELTSEGEGDADADADGDDDDRADTVKTRSSVVGDTDDVAPSGTANTRRSARQAKTKETGTGTGASAKGPSKAKRRK